MMVMMTATGRMVVVGGGRRRRRSQTGSRRRLGRRDESAVCHRRLAASGKAWRDVGVELRLEFQYGAFQTLVNAQRRLGERGCVASAFSIGRHEVSQSVGRSVHKQRRCLIKALCS